MENKIRNSAAFLIVRLEAAIAGFNKNNGQIKLLHTAEANLPEKLEKIIAAQNSYLNGRVVLGRKRQGFRAAEKRASNFVGLMRDVLKPLLGARYNAKWISTGLVGSLAKPRTAADLIPLLEFAKGHLTTNPTHQVHALKVTAHEAEVIYDELVAARNAVNSQRGDVDALHRLRDVATRAGEKALRMLLTELHKKLEPLDDRWVEFGFKQPGARSTPPPPANVSATLVGSDAVAVKWEPAPRARHYRVWKKVQGEDEDFVPVDSRSDCDFTLENLPNETVVEIAVTAVNRGGESRKSSAIAVQLEKRLKVPGETMAAEEPFLAKTLLEEEECAGNKKAAADNSRSSEGSILLT